MAEVEKRVWGIHTMNDALFLNKDLIAIGWRDFGDLSKVEATRDAFKKHYVKAYPDAKKGQIGNGAGMLYRFMHEVQIGDYIVYPSKVDRMVNIGTVESDYYYEDSDGEYVQRRKVKWLKHLPRTSFSQGALYEIGSAMSFFTVKNYADEFLSALDKSFKKNSLDNDEDDTVGATAEEIIENTKDFIFERKKSSGGTSNAQRRSDYYDPSVCPGGVF